MHYNEVKNANDALAYMVDCTLATVASMATKKSRSVDEYRRQINIAKQGIEHMTTFGVDMSGTRAELVNNCDVEAWAKQFEVN